MFVSLIVPHRNRFDLLRRCLLGLREQSWSDFEILVVDDGSRQPPPDWLEAWIHHWPRLRWLPQPHRGRAAARNTGIQHARGELVVFLDSDMAVAADFIQQHRSFHLQQGPGQIGQGLIIGTQQPGEQPPPSLWTDASRARFATGNVSVARGILLELNGFDEAFTTYGWEDLELGYRLQRCGWRSRRISAVSWHFEPPLAQLDWETDLRKERERGAAAALLFQRHPSLEIRLMTQLTPLHPLLDQLPRLGGLIDDTRWRSWIQQLAPRHPKLALALYRGLLNRYGAEATRVALAAARPAGMGSKNA